jgi:hypothetical protein
MTSRERIAATLNHKEPDRVPLDLGGTTVTGMHATTVYALRQAMRLDEPGTPVKVIDPFQMLGEIKSDLLDALGVDVVGLAGPRTHFGYKKEGWKPWAFFDGTPLLVPAGFNTRPEPKGDILMYPQGDESVPASGRMPKGGYYFDAIVRQPPIDDTRLNVEDNLEEFGLIPEDDLEFIKEESERLCSEGERAIVAGFGGSSFGDVALVPGLALKHPKGIRAIDEWYMSTVTRRDYVYRIFERQCEITLNNLERIYSIVGDSVTVLRITGTDFGMQTGPLLSPAKYRDLYLPFHKQVNDWVHRHTPWKTFVHSCGSVRALVNDFIAAGFDVLNPVQCSAAGMDPRELKAEFGDRVTFWGGGVDTQRTLPFGTPDEVRKEARERIQALGSGGGFVFAAIHNVQALTPPENLLAMYEAVQKCGGYTAGCGEGTLLRV